MGSDTQTTDEELREEALGRSWFYGLLGVLFDDVPSAETLEALKQGQAAQLAQVARGLGVSEKSVKRIESMPEAGVTSLGVEYTSLFEAHDRIYPYASCWTGEKPRLMREPWAMAQAFYSRMGLGLSEERVARADHIATELSFLSALAQRVAESESDSDARLMQSEFERFFGAHVLTWAPRFCDKVLGDPRADRYAAIAELLAAAIGAEVASTDDEPAAAVSEPQA